MSRIRAKFAELKERSEIGLILYLTVGFPDLETTLALVPTIVAAGADIIELGIPFSDPLADGATIQRSSYAALQRGVTLETCLAACQELRTRGVEVPLILMGYYNPVLHYGLERFTEACAASGADGVIVPDLPPEEAGSLLQECRRRGIDVIFLLAPTSTDERIAAVCRASQGFIYCVSLTGVTGARHDLASGLPAFIARVRQHTDLPLAVGFGISSPAHVETIAATADAAVIGSALIDIIDKSSPEERQARVREYVSGLVQSKKMTGGAKPYVVSGR